MTKQHLCFCVSPTAQCSTCSATFCSTTPPHAPPATTTTNTVCTAWAGVSLSFYSLSDKHVGSSSSRSEKETAEQSLVSYCQHLRFSCFVSFPSLILNSSLPPREYSRKTCCSSDTCVTFLGFFSCFWFFSFVLCLNPNLGTLTTYLLCFKSLCAAACWRDPVYCTALFYTHVWKVTGYFVKKKKKNTRGQLVRRHDKVNFYFTVKHGAERQ